MELDICFCSPNICGSQTLYSADDNETIKLNVHDLSQTKDLFYNRPNNQLNERNYINSHPSNTRLTLIRMF